MKNLCTNKKKFSHPPSHPSHFSLPPTSGSIWMEKMKICVRFENVPCRLTWIHFSHTATKKLSWASAVNVAWELKRIFPPALTQIPLCSMMYLRSSESFTNEKKPFFSRIQIISFPSRHPPPSPPPAPDGFEIFQPSVNNFFFAAAASKRENTGRGRGKGLHSEPDSFSYLRSDCDTNQFHIQFKLVQLFSYPLFRFSESFRRGRYHWSFALSSCLVVTGENVLLLLLILGVDWGGEGGSCKDFNRRIVRNLCWEKFFIENLRTFVRFCLKSRDQL